MRIVKSIFTKRRTQELQRLVDRYLEGGTTLDEERQLFRAFASGRYPAELEEYSKPESWVDVCKPKEG